MIIYYHCTSDNPLLLSFLLTCHPYIPFHFILLYVWNSLCVNCFFLCVYASAVSGDPGESFTVTGVVGSEGDGCFSLLRSGGILILLSLSASCEGLRPSLGLCLCVREREERGGGGCQ